VVSYIGMYCVLSVYTCIIQRVRTWIQRYIHVSMQNWWFYIHVCQSVHAYVYAEIHIHVYRTGGCVYICTILYIHTCIQNWWLYIHVYRSVHAYVYTEIHIHVYRTGGSIYMYTSAYVYTEIHIHVCRTDRCVYICTILYMYTCIQNWWLCIHVYHSVHAYVYTGLVVLYTCIPFCTCIHVYRTGGCVYMYTILYMHTCIRVCFVICNHLYFFFMIIHVVLYYNFCLDKDVIEIMLLTPYLNIWHAASVSAGFFNREGVESWSYDPL